MLMKLCGICQRYNLESYSQRNSDVIEMVGRCVGYVKDTILRAIHNYPAFRTLAPLVV